jgi:hypothetical protein
MQATYQSAPDLAMTLRRSARGRETDLGHPDLVWPQSRARYIVEGRAGPDGRAIR